jgi:hypothetical protein
MCKLKIGLLAALLVVAGSSIVQADVFGTGGNQFTIDFVPISGSTNPTSGYGIVNNDYRMGTFEITNDQWSKFKASMGVPVTGSPSKCLRPRPLLHRHERADQQHELVRGGAVRQLA